MSSETSTDPVRSVRLQTDRPDQSLQPWQFFVLAALACATAVTFIVRGEGMAAVVLLTILMGAAALVGLAVLRTVKPLVSSHHDRTVMIGERTRVALEREKMLALRAIKELEFDQAMGKIAPDDFRDMSDRLRARAIRLMKQLDAGAGYRQRIEQDLAKRLGKEAAAPGQTTIPAPAEDPGQALEQISTRRCGTCSTANDADAKFCKGCGAKL